ncbi:MAG TPA: hypothetical protein ENK26_12680, partial [Gammaproteobacteria bacterium]|nr:hypothetical protein [Gammaproteobacteria bacterium]
MIRKELTVHFNTPAFLGNAEQNGQWRTPPFKHLLREWWRVAWAEARGFNINLGEMRRTEGRLFGVAADEGDTRKSQVRIRLGRWDIGKEKNWGKGLKVFHPEVGKNGISVGSDLYLGYGPLTYDKNTKGTRLKANAGIQAGEKNDLKLAYPSTEQAMLDRALALASAFGALGGRARNGWGSLELDGGDLPGLDQLPLRDWRECLTLEWAHAIGQDENGPLIWKTGHFSNWSELMKILAKLKIDLRTSFTFNSGNNAHRPEPRHWLSYPVTNHSVRSWGRDARLPNTLRFKVRRADNGGLYGVIFHMPCKPP